MSSSSTGTSSRTSEPTRGTGNGAADCGFTNARPPQPLQPADRSASSDFRRWSRNLSSRRHKELHRLNEIEKRRQFLELRRQNDLFDQMSVTVARQQQVPPASPTSAPAASNWKPAPKDKGLQGDHSDRRSKMDANDPTGAGRALDTSLTLVDGSRQQRPKLKSASQQQWDSCEPGEPEEDESVGSFSDDREEGDETADEEQEQVDELQAAVAAGETARQGSATDAHRALDAQGEQVAIDNDATSPGLKHRRQPLQLSGNKALINQRLASLVSSPIPKNKRFLCWIVREKVSKLSKARPYFYPNYYLYIQSIVDIHETGGVLAGATGLDKERNKADSPKESHQQVAIDDTELISDDALCLGSSRTSQLPPASSTDNSISASSSISADMLFIEALSKGNLTRTGRHSFSDTEIYNEQTDPPTIDPVHQPKLEDTIDECFFDELRNPYSGTNDILLAARRRKKTKTYLIGPNEFGYARKNCICKLKSNVLGTSFNASLCSFNAKLDEQYSIASIGYETNVLGFRGPRKMRVFLPKESCNQKAKDLPELFKKSPSDAIHLKNMTPSWNIESQSYVLNFNGRVTQASVKNFQLIECDKEHLTSIGSNKSCLTGALNSFDSNPSNNSSNNPFSEQGNKTQLNSYNKSIVMQFGRISNHEFTCDITYPLSVLQGFAIALSSLDSKLACE